MAKRYSARTKTKSMAKIIRQENRLGKSSRGNAWFWKRPANEINALDGTGLTRKDYAAFLRYLKAKRSSRSSAESTRIIPLKRKK